jgi:hypothetical protein
MAEKMYLQIENSTGILYEYSKTEKEGFTRYESVNPQTKTTTISYRKYHKEGVFGKLLSITSRDSVMNGSTITQLSIALENQFSDLMFININVLDSKNFITNYAESVLSQLPALKAWEGKIVRVFPYAIENKETGNKNYGVAFNRSRFSDFAVDKENRPAKLTFTILNKEDGSIKTQGDIPPIIWETFLDKLVPNKKDRTMYLWNVMKDNTFGSLGGSSVKTFNSAEEDDEDDSNIENVMSMTPKPVVDVAPKSSPSAKPTTSGKGAMKPNPEFDVPPTVAAPVATEEDDDELPF